MTFVLDHKPTMARFELHGRSCSNNDTFYTKPSASRMSTRSTFSRSSPGLELPPLDVKSIDAMSVASCPALGGPLPARDQRNAMRRQVMSADGTPALERQCTSLHNAHYIDNAYTDRPYTRQEFKPAKATLPKRGLIKLTALDCELKNPDIFRQKTYISSAGASTGTFSSKHKVITKKQSGRRLGCVKDGDRHADIPTMWGAIQRECTTVGDLKKSILEFTDDHAVQRPAFHSYHTTLGTWEPDRSVYLPRAKSNDETEES